MTADPGDDRAELADMLYGKLYEMPAPARRTAYWLMSREWFDRILRQFPPEGVLRGPPALLGKRVVIREDAGDPRLESCPVDWVTMERTRISQAALRHAEDDIITMPELMAVIWSADG